MTYKGHIENGVAVLDELVSLQDGTPVLIEIAAEDQVKTNKPLSERLSSIIGKAQGLPEDAAMNHDHYLYGSPKR
mgnify:FL=1